MLAEALDATDNDANVLDLQQPSWTRGRPSEAGNAGAQKVTRRASRQRSGERHFGSSEPAVLSTVWRPASADDNVRRSEPADCFTKSSLAPRMPARTASYDEKARSSQRILREASQVKAGDSDDYEELHQHWGPSARTRPNSRDSMPYGARSSPKGGNDKGPYKPLIPTKLRSDSSKRGNSAQKRNRLHDEKVTTPKSQKMSLETQYKRHTDMDLCVVCQENADLRCPNCDTFLCDQHCLPENHRCSDDRSNENAYGCKMDTQDDPNESCECGKNVKKLAKCEECKKWMCQECLESKKHDCPLQTKSGFTKQADGRPVEENDIDYETATSGTENPDIKPTPKSHFRMSSPGMTGRHPSRQGAGSSTGAHILNGNATQSGTTDNKSVRHANAGSSERRPSNEVPGQWNSSVHENVGTSEPKQGGPQYFSMDQDDGGPQHFRIDDDSDQVEENSRQASSDRHEASDKQNVEVIANLKAQLRQMSEQALDSKRAEYEVKLRLQFVENNADQMVSRAEGHAFEMSLTLHRLQEEHAVQYKMSLDHHRQEFDKNNDEWKKELHQQQSAGKKAFESLSLAESTVQQLKRELEECELVAIGQNKALEQSDYHLGEAKKGIRVHEHKIAALKVENKETEERSIKFSNFNSSLCILNGLVTH